MTDCGGWMKISDRIKCIFQWLHSINRRNSYLPIAVVTILSSFGQMLISAPANAKPVKVSGSQINMTMRSTVGILLDEIPAGALRDQAAATAIQRGDTFWIEKAQRQLRFANYRLVFRGGFYGEPKGPLPLPGKTAWTIKLLGKVRRRRIDGHDYVAVDYTFRTTLISDVDSPAAVEPALANVGGKWSEPFV